MSFECLRPRLAYQVEKGQKPIFIRLSQNHDIEWWNKNLPKKYKLLLIPCNTCDNCLKRRSQEWTSRLLKELENFEYCYFITLTYSDDKYHDLNKNDLQLFLKRYRKAFGKKTEFNLKYYITGEYGEATSRAHYHAIFFQNKPIKDLRFYANNLYISEVFSKIWNLGNCLISKQVNERSIRYTVAYTLKKLGETKITLMSKGLGLSFLNNKKEEIKRNEGFYMVDGYKQRFPSYFRRKLKESSDPGDIKYLLDKENEPKESRLLTGHTLGDLARKFLKTQEEMTFKGKGEF